MKFIIGDIHGEITKLKLLVKFIKDIDDKPELIFIGDYLDKGESSKKTLDFLIQLKNELKCVFIEGNHEYQWLNVSKENNIEEYLLKYGGKLTINSFEGRENVFQIKELFLKKYKDFFENLVPYWENKKYVITHSGIPPKFYNKELNTIEKRHFLFNRYEFIKIEEKYKGKIVIFGHTGFYEPYFDGVKIGLDTSACYLENQPITSFCIDQEYFINSNNEKLDLNDINLNQCPNIVRLNPWRI